MHFRSLKKTSGELSLSDSIDSDGDGNSLSLMDVLAQEDDMLDTISAAETIKELMICVHEKLDKRESEIIILRYGLQGDTPKTQREVADICGISRSYISRIEKKAIDKLRKAMSD